MKKELKEFMEHLKNEVRTETKVMSREDREEFYSELHEWAYEHYEEALLEEELEMQDYED